MTNLMYFFLQLGQYNNPAPPTNNQFNPPNPDDIKTIYVPYEDAVNVPGVFDVSVGSSFGYSEPAPVPVPASPAPVNTISSSYDNPISSFDAPIYDENSYTAAAVSNLTLGNVDMSFIKIRSFQSSYDSNTFSDTLFYGNTPKTSHKGKTKRVRKVSTQNLNGILCVVLYTILYLGAKTCSD